MKTTLLLLLVTLLSLPVFAQKSRYKTGYKTKTIQALTDIQFHSSGPQTWDIFDSTSVRKFHITHTQAESSLVDIENIIGFRDLLLFYVMTNTITVEWFDNGDDKLNKIVCEVKHRKDNIKTSAKFYYDGKKVNNWDWYCDDIEKFAIKIIEQEVTTNKEAAQANL